MRKNNLKRKRNNNLYPRRFYNYKLPGNAEIITFELRNVYEFKSKSY